MPWKSFTLIDSQGNEVWLGDKKLFIGKNGNSLWQGELISDSEDYIENVTGMHGQYYFDKVYKERKISIQCFINEITENEKLELQRILNFRQPRKLIFDRLPYRYIWVLPDGRNNLEEIYYGDYYSGFVEINFIAYDPRYYSYYTSLDNEDYYDLRSIYSNTDLLPSDVPSPIIENITTVQTFKIYNHGNIESQPIITLNGFGTNITLTNTSNNQSFTISSMNNQEIIVDCQKGMITSGGILATSLFDGDFIELESGMNNFSITGNSLNLTSMSFNYRHTYI